jgi:pyruvate/2-oxoglutarate dehydrogenase complex dihydrolipoamide acyltransferase (E2) component
VKPEPMAAASGVDPFDAMNEALLALDTEWTAGSIPVGALFSRMQDAIPGYSRAAFEALLQDFVDAGFVSRESSNTLRVFTEDDEAAEPEPEPAPVAKKSRAKKPRAKKSKPKITVDEDLVGRASPAVREMMETGVDLRELRLVGLPGEGSGLLQRPRVQADAHLHARHARGERRERSARLACCHDPNEHDRGGQGRGPARAHA